MSLTTVLEKIKTLTPFAKEDVTEGPSETLNARRGRKTQAIEQLKLLRREYTTDLLRTSLFIVVSGVGRTAFTEESEKFGCFPSNPEDFYADLANRVPAQLYLGKEGVSNVFDVLGRHLEDKMMELGLQEYNQLIFKQHMRANIATKEDFLNLVKMAVNEQIGAEIVGIQAINALVDKAIEKNHNAKFTPVVLSTGDEQLALDLVRDLGRLTSRVFLVAAGKSSKTLRAVEGVVSMKEINAETVEATLKDISKNSLRK